MKPYNNGNSTDEMPQHTFTDADRNLLLTRFDKKDVDLHYLNIKR